MMASHFLTDFKKGGASQFDWIFFVCLCYLISSPIVNRFWWFFCIGLSIVADWYHINFIGFGPFLLCMFTHNFFVYEPILFYWFFLRFDQYNSKVVKIPNYLFIYSFLCMFSKNFLPRGSISMILFLLRGGYLRGGPILI